MPNNNPPYKVVLMPTGSYTISSVLILQPDKFQPSPWVFWITPFLGMKFFVFNTLLPVHLELIYSHLMNPVPFFETKALFYDRRKNYHKNLGRPKDRVISIPYLAQAV